MFFDSSVKWWIQDANDYSVNPMCGDFKGLPRTTIFSGTYDILNVQVEPFLKKAMAEGVEVNYIEGKK